MRKPESVQVSEATGTKAQRRQLSDDRIWRQENCLDDRASVCEYLYRRKRYCWGGRKEDSRAKLVKAIGIIIKIARG